MRKLWVVSVCLALLVFPETVVWAQEIITLDRLVVTASRENEEAEKVPANITVVTAEEIELSTAQNVAEVLRTLAGVHVMDTGGNKRNYFVDIRGYGESAPQNLLMLVDGRRINLPDLSGPDWRLIPLERIAKIEVVRGARGMVLYGDNASQGAINIITKEGREREGRVGAAYGSYDTYKVDANFGNAHDKLSYDISAGYEDTDGYRDNSGADVKDIGANLRLDTTEKLQLHLSTGYHYDNTRIPGDILDSEFSSGAKRTDTSSPDDFKKVDDYYVKLGMALDMLSNDTFKLETSYRARDTGQFSSGIGFSAQADTETDMWIVSPQLVFREDFGGISNRITIGADYKHSEQESLSTSNFGSFFQAVEKKVFAYYIHDDLQVGPKLSISGGYRYDRATYTYSPFTTIGERTFDEEAYTAGVNYVLGPNSHLYASYTHGFRYPVLDELYSFITGGVNPNIDPQTSDDIEVGASAAVTKNFRLFINLFRSETENEIFLNPLAGIVGENENLDGDVTRQGAELGLKWKYKLFSLGGTYTRTDIDIDGGQFNGNRFPYVPEDKLSATAGLKMNCGLFVGLEAIYIGDRVLISDWVNEAYKADDYTVVNAKVQYAWRRLTFYVDLNNVFDETYSTFNVYSNSISEAGRYPAPGFNCLAGVSVGF